MNVNIWIARFKISRCFVKWNLLTMVSPDGEGLSQLYLEFVDAYKKRFMPQNGQVAYIKVLSNMKEKWVL